MASKIHSFLKSTKTSGFTLIELVISIGVIIVLSSAVILYVGIPENKAKSRDLVRLSDMTYLESAIAQYKLSFKSCPDNVNVQRDSTVVPVGSTTGWINQDLSEFAPKLPVDPINNASYKYLYICNGVDYELNAFLEHYTSKSSEDGGNNVNVFESGTNLSLIN